MVSGNGVDLLLPSDLNVGVGLLDPVGRAVAPQRYELQRGFPDPDVLILRDRDAGTLEVRVLLPEEEVDLLLRRHEILEVEELHELLERAEEFEEVPIVSGDVGEGAAWLVSVVAPNAFQRQVHPIRDPYPHSPRGVRGGQVYFPDGPDHGTADGVRRVELAALLRVAQRAVASTKALGFPHDVKAWSTDTLPASLLLQVERSDATLQDCLIRCRAQDLPGFAPTAGSPVRLWLVTDGQGHHCHCPWLHGRHRDQINQLVATRASLEPLKERCLTNPAPNA